MYTEQLSLDLYDKHKAAWEEAPVNKRGTPPEKPYLPTWIEQEGLEEPEEKKSDEPIIYPDIADIFGEIRTEEADIDPDWRESV